MCNSKRYESKLIYFIQNLTKTLSQKLSDILTHYQKFKIYIKEYRKKTESKHSKIYSNTHIDNSISSNCLDDTKLTQELYEAFENKEISLEEMERVEIIKLTKEIDAVKNIFINVSNLIHQQGEIIDRIDTNIEHTMNYIDSVQC